MKKNFKDLIGKKFGALTVIKFAERLTIVRKDRGGKVEYRDTRWLCRCECGNKVYRNGNSLKNAKNYISSCGCKSKSIKTGDLIGRYSKSMPKFYLVWIGIKQRCLNKNHEYYDIYKERGVTISNRWLEYAKFKEDMYDSYLEHVKKFGKKNTVFLRKNQNKGYYAKNCFWGTYSQQGLNRTDSIRIKYNGEEKTLRQWSQDYGVIYETAKHRRRKGYSFEKIVGIEELRFADYPNEKCTEDKIFFENHNYSKLEKRTKEIINIRFGLGGIPSSHSLKETGEIFGVSRERIRQIIKKAKDDLK